MITFYGLLLYTLAVWALTYISRIATEGHGKRTYRICIVTAIGSCLWSLGYAVMFLCRKESVFLVWRQVGILGMLIYIVSGQIMINYLHRQSHAIKHVILLEIVLGAIVAILVCNPSSVIVTKYGDVFQSAFKSTAISAIYTCYVIFVALMFIYLSIRMVTKNNTYRIQDLGRQFLFVEALIVGGIFIDTILPAMGINYNIPATSILQTFGLQIIYFATRRLDKNEINIENISGYMYDSLKSPVLIFTNDHTLKIANREAEKAMHIKDYYYKPDFDFWTYVFSMKAPDNIKDLTVSEEFNCEIDGCSYKLSVDPIFDSYNDLIGYMVFASDMSLYQQYMNEMERSKNAALEANKAKSLFLANMSHEIRTPMNSILGFSQLALEDDIDNKAKEYLYDIKNSAENLLVIINDILDISKIESGKMELVLDNYDTEALFKDVALVIGVQAQNKGLEFECDIDDNLPATLYGDKSKIRQVLINLLNNSVKYTKEGFVKLKVEVIEKYGLGCTLKFAVSDSGMGIKPEDLEHIFEKFKRVDEKLNSSTEGTGLGLSICQGYINLMGGELSVESTYQKGSTFTVVIKQKVVDSIPVKESEPEKTTETNESESLEKISKLTVLAVDDTVLNLKVISKALLRYNLKIDTAASGPESIEKAKAKQYDLILMDQMMPQMDGIEAMHQIRLIDGYQAGAPAQIVALTANVIGDAKDKLLAEGFDGFLGKPVDLKELEKCMCEVADRF